MTPERPGPSEVAPDRDATPLYRYVPDPDLSGAVQRLSALGVAWAHRRGTDWIKVLNAGPLTPGPLTPATAPLHPFRWRIVAGLLRHAAGRQPRPPAEWTALPVGLQGFLAWAIPAALHGQAAHLPDRERSARARAEADALAAELEVDAAPAARPPAPLGGGPPSVTAPAGAAGGDETADLLAAALAAGPAAPLPPTAADLLSLLWSGPVPLAEVRRRAAAGDLLPGTLLDVIDRAAVRSTGVPATAVEAGLVRLTEVYRAAEKKRRGCGDTTG